MSKVNPRRTNANSNAYARSVPARKSHGGTMIGLFIGLVIGVLIAFGVVWYLNKMPLPFQDKSSRPEKTEAKPAAAAAGTPQTPQALPGKPGDKVDEKPRFEFYKILPSGQEPAPAGSDAKQPPQAAQPQAAAPAPSSEAFYLQAGAFQKSTDADNLKAKLALMGLETSLQEVNVPDKGVMHRVRVGPFAKLEDMNRVRNLLSQNGIQATVIKIKDPAQ
ncbi:MAG: SPOR domain-containing protein [Proteobacteria bacterium]|nr:SPOR domain-containing protein [Pseudomonadota bacterium]